MKKIIIASMVFAASVAGVCLANNTVGTTANPTGGTGTANWNHNNTNSEVNSQYANPEDRAVTTNND